jgi:hypothetical protein
VRGDTLPRSDTRCGPEAVSPEPPARGAEQPAPSELRSFCEAVQELASRDSHSRPRFERMLLEWARSLHNRLPVSAS